MVFVNESGLIGQSLIAATLNVTGDLFTTLLIGLMLLIIVCLAAGIPIEWVAVLMVPLLITGLSYTSAFLPITGVFLIYLGLLLAKYYFTNR